MILCFLLLGLLGSSAAALPKCSAEGCPAGGIWSEWTTSENCSASCGSCAKQYYSRTCLSTSASCPCTGDSSRYVLCNTQTCLYPAQRTCCIPYVSMLINGSMQCGPIPKVTETTSSCCPPSGLWSEWSKFGRNDNGTMWLKSRKCVSEDAGCPCTGDSAISSTSCPCRAMIDVTSIIVGGTNNGVYPINATIDQATCTYTGWLVYSTTNPSVSRPCNAVTVGPTQYDSASVIRYTRPSAPSTRIDMRVFDCSSSAVAKGANQLTFNCDLDVLYWRLDYNNQYVNGWGQINIQ